MIEIKKNQLNDVYVVLDKIKLNKISSSEVRKTILKLVLEIPKAIDNIQKEVEECRKRFFGEFANEELVEFQEQLHKIAELIKTNDVEAAHTKDAETVTKFPKLTEAYKNFNDALIELNNDNWCDMLIEQIKIDDFVESMANQDIDITAKELSILAPIFKNEPEN